MEEPDLFVADLREFSASLARLSAGQAAIAS
jgi:hypothetical protein